MKINLVDTNGVTLKTAGKFAREDIEVGLSSSDTNKLVPENIAKDVTILGVTGTREDTMQKRIDTIGGEYLFYGVAIDDAIEWMENLDFSNCKSGRYMFQRTLNWKTDTEIILDTSNFSDFLGMFSGSTIKATPKLSFKNVGANGSMYMFEKCSDLTTINEFENWDNVKKVANMFYQCSNITECNLSFAGKTLLSNTFYQCSSLTSVSDFDSSLSENCSSTFYYCKALTYLPHMNMQNNKSMYCTFEGCSTITELHFSNTGNVTTFRQCFSGCSNLVTIEELDLKSASTDQYVLYAIFGYNGLPKLENLTIRNVKQSLTIGSASTGTLLTVDSLINTIKELIDTGSSLKLTMGAANLAKIGNIYVKLTGEAEEDEANPKYPCEICESTDEGAMTIIAYANSKNWTIA